MRVSRFVSVCGMEYTGVVKSDRVLMGVDDLNHVSRYAGAWLEEGYRVRVAGL